MKKNNFWNFFIRIVAIILICFLFMFKIKYDGKMSETEMTYYTIFFSIIAITIIYLIYIVHYRKK